MVPFKTTEAVFVKIDHFPGHALHEKGLQGQMCVDPLVNSHERRAAVVPRLNRG